MLTQPVVDPEPGNDVPDEDSLEAVDLADESKNGESDGKAEVTEEDQLLVLALVKRAVGQEVADTAAEAVEATSTLALGLLEVVVVAGDVEEEVHGPASNLLTDHVDGGVDGGLLHELVHLVDGSAGAGSEDLASLGDEDHVTLHVAGGLVVLAVADLPAEVRDEESRVAEPTDKVVQDLAVGEGLVTTLVGKNPETGTDKTLDDGVESPESPASTVRGNDLGSDELVEEVESADKSDDVTGDVVEASGSRTLEAVLGDCIADVVDGVVGDLELLAVSINQLFLGLGLGLLLVVVLRSERGERSGRGRSGGRAFRGRNSSAGSRVGCHGASRGGSLGGEGCGAHFGGWTNWQDV
jgi:hypothetical protein